jgi:hypothetical protein
LNEKKGREMVQQLADLCPGEPGWAGRKEGEATAPHSQHATRRKAGGKHLARHATAAGLPDSLANLQLMHSGSTTVHHAPNTQFFFLFFQFCRGLGRWVGDHPQEDLTRFGYTSERKLVATLRIPPIFWRDVGTYCLNMATSKKFLHNVVIWAHFPLYHLHLCLFSLAKM